MLRGRAAVLLVTLVVACHESSPPTIAPASDTAAQPRESPPPEAEFSCGPGDERLDRYDFIPAGARVAASVDLAARDLEPALERLTEHARGSQHELPIDVAFALAQWSWQLPLLRSTLDRGGLQPGELVFVQLPESLPVWFFRATCDLDELLDHVRGTWGLDVRRSVDAVVATPQAEDAPGFAYDLVVLPAGRLALVPAGSASALLEALQSPSPSLGAGPTPPSPGERLQSVDAAPIRVVVQGRGLIGGEGSLGRDGSDRSLRVTAERVLTDEEAQGGGTLEPESSP